MSKKNKPAFPAKINAMGYESGLTKKEFISTLILQSLVLTDADFLPKQAIVKYAIAYADLLLTELEKTEQT